jgi:hypothetical protein
METKISHRILLWILVWFVITGAVIAQFVHLEMGAETSTLSKYFGLVTRGTTNALDIEHLYWIALAVLLVIIGILQWLSMRLSVKRIIANQEGPTVLPEVEKQKKNIPAHKPEALAKKTDVQDEQRRALHLLCLLQREGRLVDFLKEDLKPYDDAQIGAAVRSIQENCQKSLNEYLALKAVIDQEEGEEVTIQAGFDANAIKLTGNVTGEPPFKGVLQHRGWQVAKYALPSLSGTRNPKIIAPAEVEIG